MFSVCKISTHSWDGQFHFIKGKVERQISRCLVNYWLDWGKAPSKAWCPVTAASFLRAAGHSLQCCMLDTQASELTLSWQDTFSKQLFKLTHMHSILLHFCKVTRNLLFLAFFLCSALKFTQQIQQKHSIPVWGANPFQPHLATLLKDSWILITTEKCTATPYNYA